MERFRSARERATHLHNHLMENGLNYSQAISAIAIVGGMGKGDIVSIFGGMTVLALAGGFKQREENLGKEKK